MVNVLVIEDHVLVREGLVQTLRQLDEADLRVHQSADFESANALLELGQAFDLVLLDLGLPDVDGLTCLKSFRSRFPLLPVVILSAYDDVQTVNKAMRGGAAGFVSKACSSERLLGVLQDVLAGRMISPQYPRKKASTMSRRLSPQEGRSKLSQLGLTDRQSEVLCLMAKGKSNREIAGQLGLSEGTVKLHLTTSFKRLGVSSRTQAMIVAAKMGVRLV